jgi:ATP-dependent Clp protease ATP-binding subunit ClpC
VFNTLTEKALYDIIEINLSGLKKRLGQHFDFTITDEVKDLLIKDGYDEKYGARPLRRSITKLIENTLVDVILKGVKPGSTVHADVVDGKVAYEIKELKTKNKK